MKNQSHGDPKQMSRKLVSCKLCLYAFLFFITPFLVNAQAMGNKIVYSSERNATISTLLKEIEEKSDYIFFYSDDVKSKLNQTATMPSGTYTVEDVLDKTLNTAGLTYQVKEKQISLLLKPAVNKQKEAKTTFEKVIKGKVVDQNNEPLLGVSVVVEGTTRGVVTDINGEFELKGVEIPTQLTFSYIGFEIQRIIVSNNDYLNIVLVDKTAEIGEVVITGWGSQKKTTMVGSVSTVKPKELKGPTSNLTTMLAGRVAGLISYQLSGEPGRDNAEFFVRGVGTFGSGKTDPLILIDGVESSSTELARVQPDDIESFSVLKDATATSMYGSRGANGVLLIRTKGGQIGKPKFNIRYESSMSQNTKSYEIADNITYMKLANEATISRNPNAGRLYSLSKIEKTMAGANPLLYPNNNWKDLMIKDNTFNHRVNLNVSGGAEIARYYVAATYKIDNGILKEQRLNDFSTNSKSTTMEVRSNIELTVTPTTNISIRLSGLFDDLSGSSLGSGADVFKSMMFANPVQFPAVYPSSLMSWVSHPLYGNKPLTESGSSNVMYYNPYASALSGYTENNSSAITAQIEASQDFSFFTPGLKARFMAYIKRNTAAAQTRSIVPFYYQAIAHLDEKDTVAGLNPLNPDDGREYLNYGNEAKETWGEVSAEFNLYYDKVINEVHTIGGTFFGYIKDFKINNAGTLERSLAQRNVSLSGRATYGYDNRYLAEFNFGYNASERFSKENRWGFFPSIGLAWNLAEEYFMEDQKDWLDKFKVRFSYGLVGNDNLTDWFNGWDERFFYLDMVDMGGTSNNIFFGTNYDKGYAFTTMNRYGNPGITWEKAEKYNIAFEVGLFQNLNLEVDLFKDKRKNILLFRSNLPSSMGLEGTTPRSNFGMLTSKGFEATLDYNKTINKDMWLSARGTLTYSTNTVDRYDEPEYPESLSYLSNVGYPFNTLRGYIAERLFIDEDDVANSPKQFGDYMAGDIKYRDINGDGLVDSNDVVPMGYPTVPELIYGFGFSFGYKDFDISAFFQGQARSSFFISPGDISPFVDMEGGKVRGLLDIIAKDHWSEANRNPYAFYPRLSTQNVSNNNQASSWWLRDGSFLRLKTVEIGYQPANMNWLKSVGLSSVRIYVNGMNLFTISKFDLWDVEMKGNGFGYPLQRVFNAGIQLSF